MGNPDLAIRNARILDGSGAPAFVGDVSVRDGRIDSIGHVDGRAREEITADGLALAPGFIDIHTHFDPQLCWDSLATPSIEHGVTTVVIGNCSLSLAPIRPEAVSKVIHMFEVIEDIKRPTFEAAVPFSWGSFPEYLDHIRPNLGINVGALVGHSVLRLHVMGAASQERAATDAEIAAMCDLLREAMAAGALGLSASYVDVDENMRPVPSRFADMREKIALCRTMAESGRGIYQVVPYFPDPARQLDNIRELGEISRESGIPCSLQPILSAPNSPDARESIDAMEAEWDRGARVYGQVMPRCFDLNMRLSETSMLLYGLRGWKAIMDEPMPQRLESFADPARRADLVEEMNHAGGMSGAIPLLEVGTVISPDNARYVGRRLHDISVAEERPVGEVLLDIALADGLETEFRLQGVLNADKRAVGRLLTHPQCHFGASDAGAHVTQFCGTGDTTHLLEHYVRQTGQMTLEEAVHRMTGELATDWGLSDRGHIAEGRPADLVLFDPETVSCGPEIFRNDLPGAANRYVRSSEGYRLVVVNGAVVYRDGAYTDARAGRIV